jgi:hypothetical protein
MGFFLHHCHSLKNPTQGSFLLVNFRKTGVPFDIITGKGWGSFFIYYNCSKDRNQPGGGLVTKIKYPLARSLAHNTWCVYVRILSLSHKNKRKKMFGRWTPKAAKRSEEIRGKVFGAET